VISNQKYHAASRFGLGACRSDLSAMSDDPQGWLEAQLDTARGSHVDVPSSKDTLTAGQNAMFERRRKQQDGKTSEAKGRARQTQQAQDMQRSMRRRTRQALQKQIGARIEHAVSTDAPFRERLVHFYSNHFTVSQQGRPQLIGSCVGYENEAIRSTLNGHFGQMLVSAVGHPVMLLYLDNARSIGPKSQAGRRRNVGLNENLAREVLELHTLGVDGGYNQDDVQGLAKMLTGWTVGNERFRRFGVKTGEAAFVSFLHEPGKQKLLGKSYGNDGVGQATQALKDLSLHKATARHLATKLARHFIADVPPSAAVDKLEDAYLKTDGHLPSVHRQLLHLQESWSHDAKKFKTSHVYIVSVFRGLELSTNAVVSRGTLEGLRIMNHMPFTAPSPAGWPDVETHWASPSALKQRLQWGVAIGNRTGRGIDARQAMQTMLDPADAGPLTKSLARAESSSQALSLLVASPDMQWR
jgi:uncharacterized protein (DUF1800 family)